MKTTSINKAADNKIILGDLSNTIRSRFQDNVKDVLLFGSRLSGMAKEDSDYDILIILKQTPDWKTEREISDICYQIDLKYNIITDTHILGEPELSSLRGKQPIFINAIQNGLHA